MPSRLRPAAALGLLLLGAGSAQAQTLALGEPTPRRPAQTAPAAAALPPEPLLYAAAHDSLMYRVAQIHAQAEARAGYFSASQGSFGGLHRRVRTYARSAGPLVKREVVKHRFGVELQKVAYYDAAGHQVLTERYEDRQLTRLELWEYPASGRPTANWLLVRGDYLRHQFLSAPTHATVHYYHRLRPVGEGL
ncbi:hypothetical protein [Hymenobacter nivis]|uniref:Uncharacterized protein n=1 Tax=Hymenobacter nivis TaxID=1850093 RepID=A0A502GRN7_9BACT|nr:hypothetical protein [Hymenobacter nivis]TPG63583.1 hypothetical protein EAH73_16115 [Hymenobacter nivis]